MVTESILYKNKASERGVYLGIFGKLWLSLVIFGKLWWTKRVSGI